MILRASLLASALALSTVSYDPNAEVDVELLLAVDVSQSMDRDEQELQRSGYAAALVSQDFLDAVQHGGPLGRIALAYMEWGADGEQYIVSDWQIIDGPESAAHMAEEILSAPIQSSARTSISSALHKAGEMLDGNYYQGLRRVVDISGDGPSNQGGSVKKKRDELVARGIVINGLPLMIKSGQTHYAPFRELDRYYEECVIGGPGSFVVPVNSQAEFPDAIRKKLVMETVGLPPSVIPASEQERKPIDCGMFE